MNKRVLFSLLVAGAMSLHADTLTMHRCIDKALTTHPDIKTFMLRLDQSGAAYKSEKSAYFPQIALHGNYDFQRTYTLPRNGQFDTKDDNGWSAGVGLRQKLWDFEKSSHLVDASKTGREIAGLSLEEARNLLRLSVKSAYLLTLLNHETVAVYASDLKTKEALYAQAKALRRQGLKTRADELRIYAALEEAKDTLFSARSAYAKAKITLETLIGEPISPQTDFESALLKRERFDTAGFTETALLRHNPTLKRLSREARQNRQRYLAATDQRYGSIDLVADFSHVDTLSAYDSKQAGVQYTAPIFAGGKLSAEAQKLKIASQISKEQQASRTRALLQELRALKEDLKSLRYTIKAKKAQIAAAQESRKLLSARYKVGLTTYIEILDTDALYLKSRLALLQTYYRLAGTIYRLQYLTGNNNEK